MSIRIGINGYGRIGRNIVRAIFESQQADLFEIVAINDLCDIDMSCHLTNYDTTHGRFSYPTSAEKRTNTLTIDAHDGKHDIHYLSERDPSKLPWKKLGIDVVFECTGFFTSKEKCQAHLDAGAKKVIISAPGGKDVDATIVYGVNHQTLRNDMTVISNASCTTNCLSPVAKVLNDHIGIESGLMTTIHAYTNDQRLLDVAHSDMRRARAAAHSMIPTNTGAAVAVGLVLPELAGKLDGFAMRVPTLNVSVVDLSFITKKQTSVEEVNQYIKTASETTPLNEVLAYNTQPLVSSDFNHDPFPSIFDATQTRVCGTLVKVLAWYDNEWGFSNQMLRTAKAWLQK